MSDVTKAVFLSYAREDAEAVRRIADALRAFGVEVWFDQHELRGGDSWDAKIRKQIRECALFIPIISANTQARHEGYFRREWKVAVDRTADMAASRAFIMPVQIDEFPAASAEVPEEFLRYQWTLLSKGVASPGFVTQVQRLLDGGGRRAEDGRQRTEDRGRRTDEGRTFVGAHGRKSGAWKWVAAALVVGVGAYFGARPRENVPPAPTTPVAKAPATPAAQPPTEFAAANSAAKSVAVLPFANLSADPDNAFFADGVHEDVITSLAKIRDLKVISRTSVLAYRDPASRNLRKIAGELGVGTILEGSVRRAGTRVRVTAQLIDARTDEHLWAETYDAELTDVFALQGTVAKQIAAALKVNLTNSERALIERKPTENQVAYDLYLRARAMVEASGTNPRDRLDAMVSLYERAIEADPNFALAHVQLSLTNGNLYWFGHLDPTPARRARAKAAMDAAVRLAPGQPETWLARGGYLYSCENDWEAALREFRAAEVGLPNDAQVHYYIGIALRRLGRMSESAVSLARAVELNPRDQNFALQQILTFHALRKYQPALALGSQLLERLGPYATNSLKSIAQLELDGDERAYVERQEALGKGPPAQSDPTGQFRRYRIAILRKDWNAAAAALAETRTAVGGPAEWFATLFVGGSFTDPIPLLRAYVAWLQGRPEEARDHALQAIEWLRAQSWVRRQEPVAKIAVGMALAFAGETQQALETTRSGLKESIAFDKYDGQAYHRAVAARIYVVLGQRDEALETLRELFAGPSQIGPWQVRIDPILSRLKDDPRFEEILKAAKPL